eukprot:5292967-Amphidinium_carterae.1
MSAVGVFTIEFNRLRGTLPESGLRTMRAIGVFNAGENSFGGALPDACREFSMLEVWMVNHNHFEGAIPSSLDANAVYLDNNLLAGSIPHRLLGGRMLTQKT